jgi:predicted phage terminase large subunit-like protein
MDSYRKLMTEHYHAQNAPVDVNPLRAKVHLDRIVVGVDPSVTNKETSNETGIVVAGVASNGIAYVLEDLSGQYNPSVWAERVVRSYHAWEADCVVAETNQGGDLVESMLRAVDKHVCYKGVRATKGKTLRAEPIVALYEQERVFHLYGFQDLEQQMCAFDGSSASGSDRIDALVWALTDLMLEPLSPKVDKDTRRPHIWRC